MAQRQTPRCRSLAQLREPDTTSATDYDGRGDGASGYGLQHSRIPTFVEPTEFSAFELASPDGRTARIYWYSVNRNGIGNASPLTDPIKADVAAGRRVRYVLHGHPFKPSDDLRTASIPTACPPPPLVASRRSEAGERVPAPAVIC